MAKRCGLRINHAKYIRYIKAIAVSLLFLVSCVSTSQRAKSDERLIMSVTYGGVTRLYDNRAVILSLNERTISNMDIPPIIIEDRTYVPARAVFEALGASVSWDNDTKTVTLDYGRDRLIMKIGSNTINLNGIETEVERPPLIINDHTMLPARFVAEALGFFVHWNPTDYIVTILAPEIPESVRQTQTAALPQAPSTDGSEDIEAPEPQKPQDVYRPDNPYEEVVVSIGAFAKDISPVAISSQNLPNVRITDIGQNNPNQFTIKASGPISRVDKSLLTDNRLILDFFNAEYALPQATYTYNYTYLKAVRSAQNAVTPQLITRVVFDITGGVSFSVNMSEDRTAITVSFAQNYITGIEFDRDGGNDRIIIDGASAPTVTLSTLSNPDRLVIDLPIANMTPTVSALDMPVVGTTVTAIHASQYNASTGRVVADLKAAGQYSISKIGTKTIITIGEQTLRNLGYSSATRTFTLPKTDAAKAAGRLISALTIDENDDYLNLKYTFTLPGNFYEDYGSGVYVVNENGISLMNIFTEDGITRLTIEETKILAYRITEDDYGVYITAMNPKERYDKIVVIDPGHGGSDPGAVSNGIEEKPFTLDISLRLVRCLEAEGSVKVYSTRLTDVYPTRSERALFGNELGDIFVSIHCNKFNGIATGTETLYMPHINDAELGFSSETMAGIFQRNMLSGIGTKDRGAKNQDIQVLRESNIPAVLVEVSFIDSQPDLANLQNEAYRERAARAIMNGILETFGTYRPNR